MIHMLILLCSLFHYGRAQETFFPAAIPLFVRSPYLSCWGTLSGAPSNLKIAQTTIFSQALQSRSGWDPSLGALKLVILVRVDNSTYLFLGNAPTIHTSVNLTNVTISPTQTKLIAEAGPMQIELTFLNPIEPDDRVKQSIPFSYMSLTAESLDDTAHATQVYADLNPGWLSGVPTNLPFEYTLPDQVNKSGVFNYAIRPQPAWGTLYYGMTSGGHGDITANVAGVSASRDIFQLNGVLGNQIVDQNHTAADYNSVVYAISRDLGTIRSTQDPVISVVGYDANLTINYTDLSGVTQQRRLLYQDRYGGKGDILADFIGDFSDASSRAQKLDLKILHAATLISGSLADLVSLATAQVYGSFHLTASIDTNGYFNETDVMAFMRNIGGPNTTNRVNAVETLYSAFPAFVYIDPELGGFFLEPLFRLQASPEYANQYAAADLGTNYPDVTLTNSTHYQGVEHSGNMLIMTYAHARASGDVSLITRYYELLTSWANYLSNTTLLVHKQLSADGLSADNQTNLAIKGIIAIKAMSKMSSIVKRDADIDKYSSAAASLYTQWERLALTGDKHLLATYDQVDSWTLGYNLYADVWLNTSVINSSVYDGQSNFINNLSLNLAFGNSGMPVDNLGSGAGNSGPVSNWCLFAAAMMPNQDQRKNLVSRVHNRESTYPLTQFGQTISGGPSPAQGAMYAPLALEAPVHPITANPGATTGTSSKPHTGVPVVIKGIISGVAAFLAVGAMALVVWRRQRQSHKRTSVGPSFPSEVMSRGTQVTVTPFNPTWPLTETALPDAGSPTAPQQLLAYRPSSLEASPLPLQHVVAVPVGLSSKELARLRSLPVANESRPQPTDGRESTSLLTVATDTGELGGAAAGAVTSSPEALRLRLENNFLRHEIEQLHAERSEFPPSYASNIGVAS